MDARPNGVLVGGVFVLGGLLVLAGVVGSLQATRADVRTKARWICAVLLALSSLHGHQLQRAIRDVRPHHPVPEGGFDNVTADN